MAKFVSDPKLRFFDSNGNPLAGGQVWTYVANAPGTLITTYPTIIDAQNGTNPQPNPIPLDINGECVIAINNPLGMRVEDSHIVAGHGNLIWEIDNIVINDSSGGTSSTTITNIVDPNGNLILKSNYVTTAVGYVQITNAIAGQQPAIGPDTVSSGLKILNKTGVSANILTSTTYANAAVVTVKYTTATYDGLTTLVPATGICTPKISGRYLVSGTVCFSPVAGSVAGTINFGLVKNGSNFLTTSQYYPASTTAYLLSIQALIPINGTTDNISLVVQQGISASAISLSTGNLSVVLMESG